MRPHQRLSASRPERPLLESYLEFEFEHGRARKRNLMTRSRRLLEYVGAVQLGLFVACLSIFLNFIVVNLILHL